MRSLGSNKLFKDIELRIVNSKNSDLLFQIKTQILNLNHILRFITSRLKTFYLKKLLKIKNIFLKKKFKILLLNYDYNLLFFLSNKNYNISLYEDIKIKGNGDEFLEHSLKIIKNKKKSQNNKILCSIQKYLLENKDSIDLNLTSKVSKQNFKYIFWRYPVSLKTNENLLVNNEKKLK